MSGVTSSKVAIPAALFATLSPGVLLQLPKLTLMSGQTSRQSVFIHAAVFALVYKLIAKAMGIVLAPNDIIIPVALFIILSPGMLLQLPKATFMSGKTDMMSVLIHTIVFALVFAFLRKTFPQYY